MVVRGELAARRGVRRGLLLAAVLAVLVGTVGVVGFGSRLGDPPTPAPATPPPAVGEELPTFDGITTALPAGRYAIGAFPGLGLSMDVPDGWLGRGDWAVVRPGSRPVRDAVVTFLEIENLYADPCQWGAGQLDRLGATVEDLVIGLAAQRPGLVDPAKDITIGAYSGKSLDVTVPGDLSACDGGVSRTWLEPDGDDVVHLPDEHLRFLVLDIRGTRLVVVAQDFPETSATDRSALDGILDSIRIDGRR